MPAPSPYLASNLLFGLVAYSKALSIVIERIYANVTDALTASLAAVSSHPTRAAYLEHKCPFAGKNISRL
jgi:hypothetical protein